MDSWGAEQWPLGDKSWHSGQKGLGFWSLSRTLQPLFPPFTPTALKTSSKQKETLRSTLHQLWTALGLGANEVT